MKLIDKTALVTEIKRRIKTNKVCMLSLKNLDYYQGKVDALSDTISFLDTIEVKEVDLEKIINDYFKDWKFDDELDIMVKPNNYSASFTDLKEIAKHFFELGLSVSNKTEKGE